ncbi:MAG: sulfite exporter TauE/SafE family protein [Myxococcota bacterium]|nr:sulfite exporter TauE/SafE family protein [Myxococcota bacterium]
MTETESRSLVWIWGLWVAAFLLVWGGIVLQGDHLSALLSEWVIALAMLLGSYFAGSTPMGGGVVGFPTLVLLLDQAATIGRDFSLAIQAIGMTSASILIVCLRRPLAMSVLRWGLVGSLIGTPLGCLLLAGHVPDLTAKLTFAVLLASYGIVQIRHGRVFAERGAEESGYASEPDVSPILGILVGVFGGLLSSVTGVGIDTLSYIVLVLFAGCEVRAALYTSVVLMAATSVIGITLNAALGVVPSSVFIYWLTASPVVLFGAPLGVAVALWLPRWAVLGVVNVLCLLQFVWMGFHEHLSLAGWGGAILGVAVGWLLFEGVYIRGRRRLDPPVSDVA